MEAGEGAQGERGRGGGLGGREVELGDLVSGSGARVSDVGFDGEGIAGVERVG